MRAFFVIIAAFPLFAQQPVTDQDATKAIDAISGYAARLQPIMEQVKTKEWIGKGAPDTYIAQWNSAMAQLQGLSAVAKSLAPNPDRLQDLLSILFRVQMLEITAGSLEDGLRRYQNPALAELLSGTLAESTPSREKLQQYAIELATEKDKEFQLVDKEAQRCRGNLTREAPRRGTRSSTPK